MAIADYDQAISIDSTFARAVKARAGVAGMINQ
jgi:hypothetical protein